MDLWLVGVLMSIVAVGSLVLGRGIGTAREIHRWSSESEKRRDETMERVRQIEANRPVRPVVHASAGARGHQPTSAASTKPPRPTPPAPGPENLLIRTPSPWPPK